jgi:hypothetical protein
MKLNIRRLKSSDWDTIDKWWKAWEGWDNPGKDFLPENGTGGFMVENGKQPILAGFLYTTNSKVIWLDWIISNPDYRKKNRQEAIELLINASENVCKAMGYKYVFSIGRNNNLIKTHKELGWFVDEKPSHEIFKLIN